MKKKLYLMRHGNTQFNTEDRVQGVCDSPLTALGEQQARYTKAHFFEPEGIRFDHAASSTQERASDTLELVTGLPYERFKGLKEMSFGIYEGWMNRTIPHDWQTSLPQYGGELYADAGQRMVKTLTELMDRDGYESVLAVSHGCAIQSFLETAVGEPALLNNCSVTQLDYDPEDHTFSLVRIWQNPIKDPNRS